MKKIYYVKELVIETTRRCNMACAHCLRGDAQDKDITSQILSCFFNSLTDGAEIGDLTFTGGEISLNVPLIQKTLELCQKKKLRIGSFFMVTNGKDSRKIHDLALVAEKWEQYISDIEQSGLALSKDRFHEPIAPENEQFITELAFYDDCKDMTLPRYRNSVALLNEGRAKNLDCQKAEPDTQPLRIQQSESGTLSVSEGLIYLAANGNVLSDCDLSYDHEDARAIVNVQEKDWLNVLFAHTSTSRT